MNIYIKMMKKMEEKLVELMGESDYQHFSEKISKEIFMDELKHHAIPEFRQMAEDDDVFNALTGSDEDFRNLLYIDREFRNIVDDEEEEDEDSY